MAEIDDTLLSHLFALARIEEEKNPEKRAKLRVDLTKILRHFEELQELDTDAVKPVAGGTFLTDVTRTDGERVRTDEERATQGGRCVDSFPEKEQGQLKVPPVF